ncbi:Leader peptidase PppA [Posidoniimonas polymericola]|uniref:Leader peptidase PppA n=1 Tax=Posidoniimonas polymericola TaxID=2528002 RepID=A0A5C5ZDH4_9BACT|nr:prepilin peptidase [Posidoniimonas polymericola]TWT85382.1 Leader peptidase PppA [Posidoniimonas polymericola]
MWDWLNTTEVPTWLEAAPLVALELWLFAVGGCIGSFLNVVYHRVPRGEDIVVRGSHCPVCDHPIRWRHNLPVIGWLVLRGKCYDCKAPIPIRYWLFELFFGALFAIVGWWVWG